MRLLILCLLGLTWGSDPSGARPLLPTELLQMEPERGQEFDLHCRYAGMLGSRLTVEDCPFALEISAGTDFPVLREMGLRDGWLRIRVRAADTNARPPRFIVLDVAHSLSVTEFFDAASPGLDELPPPRQKAIFDWCFEESVGNEELNSRLAKRLLDSVRDRVEGPDRTEALDWLRYSHEHARQNDRWMELALGFARRHADRPAVARELERLGLIRVGSTWRAEEGFLAEIGMARHEGSRITLDRLALEKALASWTEDEFIRALTPEQYLQYAEEGLLQEGMNRPELVRAWGFPERVTWLRRGERYYEGWFYPAGSAFLRDGHVFAWE